ncbi:MAG: hypothetical protein LBM39_02740 [Candidatus Methanoplasma sp.]|jgi:hypothetical protein|nr:hypothetical protein [Candidatus Methanoplasma sp.]
MFAIVACGNCKRYRVIDRSSQSSKCPFCNDNGEHKYMRIVFQDESQTAVREALGELSGYVPEKEKQRTLDSDPFSTLVYRYEHCSDITEKLEILAKGLTAIYGTFTEDEISQVDPKNPEKLLRAMLELCIAHEVKYGRYSA